MPSVGQQLDSHLNGLVLRKEIVRVVYVDVSFLPVEFVVEHLVHVRVGQRDVEALRIDKVAKVQSVVYVHEDVALTIREGERHLRVKVRFDVGRTGGFVLQESRVDEVTAADERNVPETSKMRRSEKIKIILSSSSVIHRSIIVISLLVGWLTLLATAFAKSWVRLEDEPSSSDEHRRRGISRIARN